MSLFIVGLDVTVVNVALPTIHEDLGASISQLQWVIDAYTLVLASLLMLSGSTADRLGRARIFKVGLALFTAGSLLCGGGPAPPPRLLFPPVPAGGGALLHPPPPAGIRPPPTHPPPR